MSANAQAVLAMKKSLASAVTASRTEEVKSILLKLKKEVVATEELIRETKIGVAVNKLRQNPDKAVADLAKEIVRKWKADVGPAASSKAKDSPSATASAVPSPSPAPGSPPVTKSSAASTPSTASTTAAKPKPAPAPVASSSKSDPAPKRRESQGGGPRTHKDDGLDFSSDERAKGDKTRDKCAEMVYDALALDSDAPTDLIFKRARDLEEYVYKQHPPPSGTNVYRQKMRSLFLNLKAANNPALREDVVSGDISVSKLYAMKPEDMASEEQRAINRKLVEENLFKAQGAAPQQAETDAFQCGKCKQRRTMYYQMQTRSADEPMTTFVTCLNCNNSSSSSLAKMLSSAASSTPIHLLPRQKTATPSTYLKYSFPLPQGKRYVGILACQLDPLLTTLDSTVIKCEKKVVAPPAGKPKKGAKAAEVPDEWEVELEDTVLFPEGGGQPSDKGTIQPLTPEGQLEGSAVNVRQVIRRNLDAIHYCSAPLEVGTRVRVTIDEVHRRDLMSQHTGQHLLSAIFDTLKLETQSWSLTEAPAPCYIELERAPTADEIALVQARVNSIISSGSNISVEMSLPGQDGFETPTSVPSDYKGADGSQGVIRTVEIEGIDRNPCCGTHFPSVSYLQALFILPHTTSVRGTNARVYFLVGPRVFSHLASSHASARESSMALSCTPAELPERVAALQLSSRDTLKREKRLREELASFLASKLLSDARVPGSDILRAVSVREEDATNSNEFLSQIAFALKGEIDELPAPAPRHVFILACCASPSTTQAGGSILIFGTEDLVMKAGKAVTAKMGTRVKGGGKGRWQGKLVSGRWEPADKKAFVEILQSVQE
ncbi:threonyl/alanyl tRNA synthetase, class II-like putative editing domain containing protein [Pseudohyphozyma bogoriensis]|nr:threonyl/alanyl tRNA synthetase, class II-like putative editing domain containing protein [Pseudohyphozyma bogoriensis]